LAPKFFVPPKKFGLVTPLHCDTTQERSTLLLNRPGLGSGADLADAWPQAYPLVRLPLPLFRGKNGKALISLRKAENDNIDALNVQSIKNSASLLECPTITALVAALDAKAVNDTELLKSCLASGNAVAAQLFLPKCLQRPT